MEWFYCYRGKNILVGDKQITLGLHSSTGVFLPSNQDKTGVGVATFYDKQRLEVRENEKVTLGTTVYKANTSEHDIGNWTPFGRLTGKLIPPLSCNSSSLYSITSERLQQDGKPRKSVQEFIAI